MRKSYLGVKRRPERKSWRRRWRRSDGDGGRCAATCGNNYYCYSWPMRASGAGGIRSVRLRSVSTTNFVAGHQWRAVRRWRHGNNVIIILYDSQYFSRFFLCNRVKLQCVNAYTRDGRLGIRIVRGTYSTRTCHTRAHSTDDDTAIDDCTVTRTVLYWLRRRRPRLAYIHTGRCSW